MNDEIKTLLNALKLYIDSLFEECRNNSKEPEEENT